MCLIAFSISQIELFWLRAINDPEYKHIFCLIHAEKLSYQVSDQALSSLSKHIQGEQGICILIVQFAACNDACILQNTDW